VESGDENDRRHATDKDFGTQVSKRKPKDLMNFADYDHYGRATEFLLQVATTPCGKHQMILVGVSKSMPLLHVFSTPEKPNSPLLLGAWEWEALLKSDGHTSVTDWNCGDHGSGYEWKAILDAHDGALLAKLRSYECNAQGSAGKLIEVVVR
jgi:hypothetical protein